MKFRLLIFGIAALVGTVYFLNDYFGRHAPAQDELVEITGTREYVMSTMNTSSGATTSYSIGLKEYERGFVIPQDFFSGLYSGKLKATDDGDTYRLLIDPKDKDKLNTSGKEIYVYGLYAGDEEIVEPSATVAAAADSGKMGLWFGLGCLGITVLCGLGVWKLK